MLNDKGFNLGLITMIRQSRLVRKITSTPLQDTRK